MRQSILLLGTALATLGLMSCGSAPASSTVPPGAQERCPSPGAAAGGTLTTLTIGAVKSVGHDSLTIQDPQGRMPDRQVTYDQSVTVRDARQMQRTTIMLGSLSALPQGSLSDLEGLAVGSAVAVEGQIQSDGSVQANVIALLPARALSSRGTVEHTQCPPLA